MLRTEDRIRIDRDMKAEGEDLPVYKTRFASVPCNARSVSGSETFRGRKLTEHTDYVIELWWTPRYREMKTTDRVTIIEGMDRGTVLNIGYINTLPRQKGKRRMIELHCRTVDGK